MKTVVCIPFWPEDSGRRGENFAFTRKLIEQDHSYPIFVGEHPAPGTARNLAAQAAGDWDVAVMWDADNLAHPDAVRQAVARAADHPQMVVAGDCHLYMSEPSSRRILDGERWMPRPYDISPSRGVDHGCQKAFWRYPCSGVYAIGRELWDRIGGFVETMGCHGKEDLVFLQCCCIWGQGNAYIDDHILLHLWHPPGRHATHPTTNEARANTQLWHQLSRIRGHDAQYRAAKLLATVGHTIPAIDTFLATQTAEWERYTRSQAGRETVCGPGSTLAFTAALRDWLPTLITKYGITSILDAPCGDHHWMAEVDLTGVDYHGIDLQDRLIRHNQRTHRRRRFTQGNLLTTTTLPAADLILCRDFFAHIPDRYVAEVLQRFRASGAKYLLATNFHRGRVAADEPYDQDGFYYRPVSLTAPPFSLPRPIETLDEPGPEKGRHMALFRLQP